MNVLLALDCSELAYKNHEKKFYNLNCVFVQNLDSDAQAYVIYDEDCTIVSFRGTSSMQDVFSDLNAFSIAIDNKSARIHAGFLEQYQSLEADILRLLDKDSSIVTTGHSLGGAMAQIAAFQLQQKGFKTATVHFGSPRVGNKAFAELMAKKVPGNLAVVHTLDPVPQFPSFWGWWKHPSTKRLEIDKNNMIENFVDKNSFHFQFWKPAEPHTLKSYKNLLTIQKV